MVGGGSRGRDRGGRDRGRGESGTGVVGLGVDGVTLHALSLLLDGDVGQHLRAVMLRAPLLVAVHVMNVTPH